MIEQQSSHRNLMMQGGTINFDQNPAGSNQVRSQSSYSKGRRIINSKGGFVGNIQGQNISIGKDQNLINNNSLNNSTQSTGNNINNITSNNAAINNNYMMPSINGTTINHQYFKTSNNSLITSKIGSVFQSQNNSISLISSNNGGAFQNIYQNDSGNSTQNVTISDLIKKNQNPTKSDYENLNSSAKYSIDQNKTQINSNNYVKDFQLNYLNQFIDYGDCVVINVNDEVRKIKKNFKCKRLLLLNHMQYFEQYLKEDNSGESLDISVHCDVKIFEWLIKYVDYYFNLSLYGSQLGLFKQNYLVVTDKSPDLQITHNSNQLNTQPPELDIKSCISILISAEFLKIKQLVDEASLKVTLQDLDNVDDPKNKLSSRIYMKKVDELLKENENKYMMQLCQYCKKLFTIENQDRYICPKAKIFIDCYGSLDLLCNDCGEYFDLAHIYDCRYHPGLPTFNFDSNEGAYKCCLKKAYRFEVQAKSKGCQTKQHNVYSFFNINNNQTVADKDLLNLIIQKKELTQEPVGEEAKIKPSFQQSIRNYIIEHKDQLFLVDEDEDDANALDYDQVNEQKHTDDNHSKSNNMSIINYNNVSIGSIPPELRDNSPSPDVFTSRPSSNRIVLQPNARQSITSFTGANNIIKQLKLSQQSQSNSTSINQSQQIQQQQQPLFQIRKQNAPVFQLKSKQVNRKQDKNMNDSSNVMESELNHDLLSNNNYTPSPSKLSPKNNIQSVSQLREGKKQRKAIKIDCANMSKLQISQFKQDNLRQTDKFTMNDLVQQLKKFRVQERSSNNFNPSSNFMNFNMDKQYNNQQESQSAPGSSLMLNKVTIKNPDKKIVIQKRKIMRWGNQSQ
eukprot:403364863